MKKFLLIALVVFTLLLVLPMLFAMYGDPDRRPLEGVRLQDTAFEEITFRNEDQGLQLAGMLFVPQGEGPFPAAVIIHGSGTSRRDNGWYLTLTKHLQDSGVAVLLPDKRGSEDSEGDWRTSSFPDLATDTLAAVDYLVSHPLVDTSAIGLVGLSQGGHIAPLAASMTGRVSFVVNIVGGAVPMHEQLVYEEIHNLRQMGMLPGFSNLFARLGAWSLIRFRQQEFWAAVGNFDALPYWRQIPVPSLILYGEDDTNVPSQRSAAMLRALGNPNLDVRMYPGSGHALESPPGTGNSVFRPDALEQIAGFVLAARPEPGQGQ